MKFKTYRMSIRFGESKREARMVEVDAPPPPDGIYFVFSIDDFEHMKRRWERARESFRDGLREMGWEDET